MLTEFIGSPPGSMSLWLGYLSDIKYIFSLFESTLSANTMLLTSKVQVTPLHLRIYLCKLVIQKKVVSPVSYKHNFTGKSIYVIAI